MLKAYEHTGCWQCHVNNAHDRPYNTRLVADLRQQFLRLLVELLDCVDQTCQDWLATMVLMETERIQRCPSALQHEELRDVWNHASFLVHIAYDLD